MRLPGRVSARRARPGPASATPPQWPRIPGFRAAAPAPRGCGSARKAGGPSPFEAADRRDREVGDDQRRRRLDLSSFGLEQPERDGDREQSRRARDDPARLEQVLREAHGPGSQTATAVPPNAAGASRPGHWRARIGAPRNRREAPFRADRWRLAGHGRRRVRRKRPIGEVMLGAPLSSSLIQARTLSCSPRATTVTAIAAPRLDPGTRRSIRSGSGSGRPSRRWSRAGHRSRAAGPARSGKGKRVRRRRRQRRPGSDRLEPGAAEAGIFEPRQAVRGQRVERATIS